MDRRGTALEERTEAEYAHRTIKPGWLGCDGKEWGRDERTKSRVLRAKDGGGKNGSQRDRTIDARPRTRTQHVDGARLKILDE